MDLINVALLVNSINFRAQVLTVAFLLLILVIGILWGKLTENDGAVASTIVITMILFCILIPIRIHYNAKNKASAFAAIESAGPDTTVSAEIESYLNGTAVPGDSWYLRAAYDDDTVRRILMTYAPVFENKTGKPWDRDLVYWDAYFEKVVRPLFSTQYVKIKN